MQNTLKENTPNPFNIREGAAGEGFSQSENPALVMTKPKVSSSLMEP